MKIVVLIAGGRAGTDFFQSLLDRHTSISQLPGSFAFDQFWIKSKNEKSLEKIAEMFINDYKHFFDSRLNILERHHALGDERKSFYLVDKKLFIRHFINIIKSNNFNQSQLLVSLNLAYSASSGEDLSTKQIIVLNLHHLYRINFLKELDFEIIYSIRDPLSNYTSVMNELLSYQNRKQMTPWAYYFHLNRMFNGLKDAINSTKKVHVIKLDKLHTDNVKVMKNFCSIFNIQYKDSLTESTYHNKKWWGDATSKNFLDGVNPNFADQYDKGLFFEKDIMCLEYYLNSFITKYNYPITSGSTKCKLLKYLPLKGEFMVWKKTITTFSIKNFLSIFVYWIKRVNLMNSKIYQNINYPDPIGEQ